MNLSVRHSLHDELLAAFLLAFDYIRGVLQTGIGTKRVNGFFENSFSRAARRCLPIFLSIALLIVTTLRMGVSTGRGHQMHLVSRSSEIKTKSTSGTVDAHNGTSRTNGCMKCTGTSRYSEAQQNAEAYFAPSNQTVDDDFDADGHVQMCLKDYCSSESPEPQGTEAHCS
ncbi:hypothetical protein TRSC58_04904 [Trypanosoma rangeli SC58]|uniref:Uncharacterized protein n=1 Tax=Trypanosoma rangeli SC58 TaxID=429131 RepID=A0A061IZU3_TRYRA|nr:hypothetical protein TRSC58_04904 [Trypanosoma rangeli SC58]